MIIAAVIILLLISAFFIALPAIKGEAIEPGVTAMAKSQKLEQLEDRKESIKLSLRDIDLEQQIGKIDAGDFEVLKNELLGQWAEVEDEIKKLSGEEKQE